METRVGGGVAGVMLRWIRRWIKEGVLLDDGCLDSFL